MRISINNVDIAPLVAYQGVQWTRNDYCPKSVTTMDGKVWRGRVTSKAELALTFRPLTTAQLNDLMSILQDEYLTVAYDDPINGYSIVTMYVESLPAKMMLSRSNGTEYWTDISVTLKER